MADSVTRQLLIRAAERRGWQWKTLGANAQILVVDNGITQCYFKGSRPAQSSANGCSIAISKELTLEFIEHLGITVPSYRVITSDNALRDFLEEYHQIVVKPSDSEQSKGVTVDITSLSQAKEALVYAHRHSRRGRVIAQQQLGGKLYRLFVLNGRVPVVTERRAATVMGDGEHTVAQLIEILNQDPRRGNGTSTPMKQVSPDKAEAFLGPEVFHHIPGFGVEICVAAIASVSEGGEAYTVTNEVHDSWKKLSIEIADALGLFVAGFDIMTDRIHEPVSREYFPLLEINSAPGFKIHAYPSGGEAVPLADLLLDEVFQALQKNRNML